MFFKFSRFIFIAVLFLLAVASADAQIDSPDASNRSGANNKEDFPKGIKESLAKSRIEREKKDHEELIQNGEEVVKLSENLEKSFAESNTLSSEDQKKLDRLEKLAKKIRKELGASDGDDTDEDINLSSMRNAFQTLQSNTNNLVSELKKTTRYSISVVAVQSSNTLLKIVKFIRFGKN